MTHHTWKHRFETALRNKNWKKIIIHDLVEYAILGSVVLALGPSFQSLIIGALVGVSVHMIIFELVDTFHPKKKELVN